MKAKVLTYKPSAECYQLGSGEWVVDDDTDRLGYGKTARAAWRDTAEFLGVA